jgi:transcriptional regulator with XRE-family HTH domain
MSEQRRLADYLRARRERLQPSDVGLAVGSSPRRVPGLRREEVAILAGISTDYYLRLEQGRDANPSDQVLDALARALRLDPVATAYLRELARTPEVPTTSDAGDLVRPSTLWLIDSWPLTAAIVHNRYIDVLASNALARALNPNYRAGVNGVLSLMVDENERTFHTDWEALAARSVALLRGIADKHAGDSRLTAMVEQGSASSALFREFWARQDVRQVSDGVHHLWHPHVGALTLTYQRLPLIDSAGQSLFLYYAEPGSASEEAMRQLATEL